MELPKRKHPRLKNFDYSQDGTYSITICSHNKKNVFSTIDKNQDLEEATVKLTSIGEIAKKHILALEERYENLQIITYVIMPNHIHLLLGIINQDNVKQNRIDEIICAYKSIVAKDCKKNLGVEKLFQTSFYDHVITNERDFQNAVLYIDKNPAQWIYDKYYSDGSIST